LCPDIADGCAPMCKALSMQLADAIEQWGLANRTKMNDADTDIVRMVWSAVRVSDSAKVVVEDMTSDESRVVMALFSRSQRKDVAVLLNEVFRWATSGADSSDTPTRAKRRREEVTIRSTPTPAGSRGRDARSEDEGSNGDVGFSHDEPGDADARPGNERPDGEAESGDENSAPGHEDSDGDVESDGDAESGDEGSDDDVESGGEDSDGDAQSGDDARSGDENSDGDAESGEGDSDGHVESDDGEVASGDVNSDGDAQSGDKDAESGGDSVHGDPGSGDEQHRDPHRTVGAQNLAAQQGETDATERKTFETLSATEPASAKTWRWYLALVLAVLSVASIGVIVYVLLIA